MPVSESYQRLALFLYTKTSPPYTVPRAVPRELAPRTLMLREDLDRLAKMVARKHLFGVEEERDDAEQDLRELVITNPGLFEPEPMSAKGAPAPVAVDQFVAAKWIRPIPPPTGDPSVQGPQPWSWLWRARCLNVGLQGRGQVVPSAAGLVVNASHTRLEHRLQRVDDVQHPRAQPQRFVRSSVFVPMVALPALFVPGQALSSEEGIDAAGGERVRATPAISVGGAHVCAVGVDGILRCWGTNGSGQLGVGAELRVATPARVPLDHVVEIAAGFTHTCALDAEGVVWCWGENRDGELGDGTREDRRTPVRVRGLSDVVHVAAGRWRTCAVRVDGVAFCWGNGMLGALGDGRKHTSDLPVPVTRIDDAVAIAVGEDHACAVHAAGRVSCWGLNASGQLGDGSHDDSAAPRVVVESGPSLITKPIENAASVGAGSAHTCVAHHDGTVSCWGSNRHGQLGAGGIGATSFAVRVAKLSRAKAVALGWFDSCALLSDGTARCWGTNWAGQLGDGTTTNAREPIAPQVELGGASRPLADLVAVSTGDTTAAVDASGVLWTWGSGYLGQLGDGTDGTRKVPAPVPSFR